MNSSATTERCHKCLAYLFNTKYIIEGKTLCYECFNDDNNTSICGFKISSITDRDTMALILLKNGQKVFYRDYTWPDKIPMEYYIYVEVGGAIDD